jgi:hypothetical protein
MLQNWEEAPKWEQRGRKKKGKKAKNAHFIKQFAVK